ncbi:MAG TPA: glycosyl hydrolase family 28-related protein [Longimicrobium sp.]|nr:glycosyl hydrolase family 28-related protein [Longimicrobium sp.]
MPTYDGTILDDGGAVFNVRSAAFGAVGDGVNDDTAEIQAAINAAQAAGVSRHGATVLLPPGKYKFTQLVFTRGKSVRFVGAGQSATVLAHTGSNDMFVDSGSGTWAFAPHFEGFRVEGSGSASAFNFSGGINRNMRFQELQILLNQEGYDEQEVDGRVHDGFRLPACVSTVFDQVEVLDARYAFYLSHYDGTPSSQTTFRNCKSERSKRGFYIQGTSTNRAGGFLFLNCKTELGAAENGSNGDVGFSLEYGNHPVFIRCSSEDDATQAHYALSNVEAPQFINCSFSGSATVTSLSLVSCKGAQISGGRAAGAVTVDSASTALIVDNLVLGGAGESQLSVAAGSYDIAVMTGDPASTIVARRKKRLEEYYNASSGGAVQRFFADGDTFPRAVDLANGVRQFGTGSAAVDATSWERRGAGAIGTPSRIVVDDGITVGGGLKVSALLGASTNWDPPSMAADAAASTTLSVPGATTGSVVIATHAQIGAQDILISGHVQAADTVRVVLHNKTGGTVDLGNGTLRAWVFVP